MGLDSELKGKFGFYRFGTNHTYVPASDIASVGYITFDGSGHGSISELTFDSGSSNSVPTSFPAPTPFSYKVSANGTFAVTESSNLISDGVIVDGGNGFYSMSRVNQARSDCSWQENVIKRCQLMTVLAAAPRQSIQCKEDLAVNKAGRITGSFSSLLVRMETVKSKRVFGFLGLTCLLFLSGCSIGVPSPSSSVQLGDPPPSTPASIAVGVTPGFTDLIAGSSLQLSASVVGDSANKGVTWSVLPASCVCGTIDSTGKYSAPKIPPVSPWVEIVATSIADPTKSGNAGIFLFAAPSGLIVSPYIGSVQVNGSQQFSATATSAAQQFVTTTSASSPAVTWSLTGTGCTGADCGSIDSTGRYTAPATAPNPPNIKVMALIAANPPLVGSADVTISIDADNSNNSKLKGQYAFLLKGLNDDGNAALAGSFVADGNGNITSGTGNYVYSDSLESLSNLAFTGTYSVNFDNRALVALTVKNPGPPTTFSQSFSFALGDFQGGVANRGHLVETDDQILWATGVLAKQDPTAFSTAAISGSYAFEFTGSGSTSHAITTIGRFDASGGTITGGHTDVYGLGVAFDGSGTPTWTPDMNFGGVYQVSSDGSGSAAFSFSGNNPGFSQFALYVISANELFFIEKIDSCVNRIDVVISYLNCDGEISGLVLKQSAGHDSRWLR